MRTSIFPDLQLLLLTALLGFPSSASSAELDELKSLAASSDCIVLASIQAKEAKADDAGRIFTTIDIKQIEAWKGGPVRAFVQAGGVLGERREVISHQAQFRLGERCLLFLVKNPLGEWSLNGLERGKIEVRGDSSALYWKSKKLEVTLPTLRNSLRAAGP